MFRTKIFHTKHPWITTALAIIRMGSWGIPGIIIGLGLNFIFVDFWDWNPYVSYLVVLALVSTLNYVIIEKIVFSGNKIGKIQNRVLSYALTIAASRLGEWGFYSFLTGFLGFFYLHAQIIGSLLFIVLKYYMFKRIMR